MSEQCTCHTVPTADRRRFLSASSAVAAMALIGGGMLSAAAHADAVTKAKRDKLTPDDVLALMKKGNRRFNRGTRKDHNYLAQQRATAAGQYPLAVLLSCIDSRAPAETIMDLRIGDIFNSRVAGNVENADILGSMEFACKLSGAKVVLVMGHTSCGAIKGAIDNAELGNLTGLLAKIKPAVTATAYSGERTSKSRSQISGRTAPCLPAWNRAAPSRSPVRCTACRRASSISSRSHPSFRGTSAATTRVSQRRRRAAMDRRKRVSPPCGGIAVNA